MTTLEITIWSAEICRTPSRHIQGDINRNLLNKYELKTISFERYRARDYCTSGKHVVNMCLNVIKVSVYLNNWSHVVSYVNKALATPDYAEGMI